MTDKIDIHQITIAYQLSKAFYEKNINRQEAVDKLSSTGMNPGSAFIYLIVFKYLMEGQHFKRTLSAKSFDYFLGKILEDFGNDQLIITLEALRLHIKYLEEFRNYKMGVVRSVYEKYLKIAKNIPNDNTVSNETQSFPEGRKVYKLQEFNERNETIVNFDKQNHFITMVTKITRPASLVKQGDLTLYATSLKVADLIIPNFYSIERLDPENANEKGYQRLLNKGRAKKLADYIVSGQETRDAFLPTSIFMATDRNIAFNPSNNTIEIDISEVCPFNIVDGQHRVEGLKMAAEKDKSVLEFEVPVNIAINLSKLAQMCHFLIVNTTQKSVEQGVEQRIYARLTKALELEDDIPHLPKWIRNTVGKGEDEKALKYVDFLNTTPESPWKNRIDMANKEDKSGSIAQKSFVKSLKKYVLVADNPVASKPEDVQHGIFLNYWKAITNIIGTDEPTVLFKYNGVELFCKFFVPFCHKMINMPNFKVSTMQSLLEHTFENVEGEYAGVGHTEFWISGKKASGLNVSALTGINSELVKALHSSNTHKEIEL